jgi:hypothetical protein
MVPTTVTSGRWMSPVVAMRLTCCPTSEADRRW